MVRNTASTPNLRSSMSNSQISSSAARDTETPDPMQFLVEPTASSPSSSGPVSLSNRSSVQLRGSNPYTKGLMNRVATGQANAEELKAFNRHVEELELAKLREEMDMPGAVDTGRVPTTAPGNKPGEDGSGVSPSQKTSIEEDAEAAARHENLLLDDANVESWMAKVSRRGDERRKNMAQFMLDERRLVLASKEKEVLGHGEPGSLWPMFHNPILYKRHDECTFEENAEVERLWKQYLKDQTSKRRKSKETDNATEPKVAEDLAPEVNEVKEEMQEDMCFPQATRENASEWAEPFCKFMQENPTVYHAVDSMKSQLTDLGWTYLDERAVWKLQPGGKYFTERNGSSMIAFVVGANYKPGNGAAIVAGHVDALTAKLKPVSEVPNKAGYLQLGVAPYAGGMNETWWDRDLGIGGRVLVKTGGKIETKLVNLNWPIAKIPTLAPHFGAAAQGPFNKETQMVPIIGLDNEETHSSFSDAKGRIGSFATKQPPALVKAISEQLGLHEESDGVIVNWDLELYDVQPATVGGLNKEFIFAGRIDDKLCSWAAMQALLVTEPFTTPFSSAIKVVGWFDNEEIGSGLRQGARSNFLPQTIERAVGCLSKKKRRSDDLIGRTYANSFILSSDVTHAVNPNFLSAYLENHAPQLNIGVTVAADPNGNMTTDAVSTAILQRCADRVGAKLQVFQIRNDSRSGGTVGPMLSSMTGIRAIDAGIPQLSMHSIRATTGSLDPGLGVICFIGFLNGFEYVDEEFKS